ncbi:oligosaccharide flippase family protein [Romboutsia sp.]|uniref:oligosaccharide flippase family protein n=1 Tax=Romboutsia sp. TaxID=1965302 RepID=UPI003F305E78
MKRKKLIINALILTCTTMILGFISTSFRVYLSNKIGPEGMGLFQLIMSINIMTCTLAISGIRVTTTRLIAEELGKGNKNKIKNIMKKAFAYSLFFSILACLLLYNSAEFISTFWIDDTRAILPLKILSCSLPFVSLGACIHGYFYGMRKVIKSISSDVIEVSTMMIIISSFMSICLPKGLNFTCILIAVGMSVSVVVSTIYSYFLYIFEKKSFYRCDNPQSKCKLTEITSIAIPIAWSAYIQTGLRTIEDLLIPEALRKYGSSTSASLSAFGMIKGMVLPILSFPSIFLASFSTLIIPEIAESSALNQKRRINYILAKVFKFTLFIAVFASGVFIIYSNELGVALYNDPEVGVMMRILAPLIPFMYLDRIVDGSLNALNQQMSTLRYNFIDMGVRILLICFLIPQRGIEGFICVLFVGTILNASLSINRLLKVTKLNFRLFDWLIKPIICIAVSCFLVKYSFTFVGLSSLLVIQLLIVMATYLFLLLISKSIKKEDIMWFVDAFRKDIKVVEWNDLGIYKYF